MEDELLTFTSIANVHLSGPHLKTRFVTLRSLIVGVEEVSGGVNNTFVHLLGGGRVALEDPLGTVVKQWTGENVQGTGGAQINPATHQPAPMVPITPPQGAGNPQVVSQTHGNQQSKMGNVWGCSRCGLKPKCKPGCENPYNRQHMTEEEYAVFLGQTEIPTDVAMRPPS